MAENRRRLTHPDWAEDVREGVNAFLDSCDPHENLYAVSDFDNTITIFDTEDQMLGFQLDTMSFAIRPEDMERVLCAGIGALKKKDEAQHRRFLDLAADAAAAYAVLWDRYGGFSAAGAEPEKLPEILKDPHWAEFSAKAVCLFNMAYGLLSPEAADLWMMHFYYGMRREEIYRLSARMIEAYRDRETCSKAWKSPEGIPSRAGTVTADWVYGYSVSENMQELVRALHENGVDLWICSASDIDAVRASVDAFGLHDSVRGVLGMTPAFDSEGRCTLDYDLETGFGCYSLPGGEWEPMKRPTRAVTCEEGKVTAIRNALVPEYGGRGPAAGFMDSEGDFAFCTSFDSMRLVLCINRANRRPEDGGSLMARAALFQKAVREGRAKAAANERSSAGPAVGTAGMETSGMETSGMETSGTETVYLLQGRSEQGLRGFRKGPETLLFGEKGAILFQKQDNILLQERDLRDAKSVREILGSRKKLEKEA